MGILLVYDVTNAKSFDNISKWLRNIEEHANEEVEKMLLGNKCDMIDRRVISTERGESIAREHGIRFLETSAKANINIEKVFMDLAESILDKQISSNDRKGSDSRTGVTVSLNNRNRGSGGGGQDSGYLSRCCSG